MHNNIKKKKYHYLSESRYIDFDDTVLLVFIMVWWLELCKVKNVKGGVMFSLSMLLFLQIDSDDVITRDEQIFLLIDARARCERSIRAQLDGVRGIIVYFCLICALNCKIASVRNVHVIIVWVNDCCTMSENNPNPKYILSNYRAWWGESRQLLVKPIKVWFSIKRRKKYDSYILISTLSTISN